MRGGRYICGMTKLNTISSRVAWALKQKGISPYQASLQLKCTPSYLPKLLTGRIKTPAADKMLQLAEFLGVDFKWLITGVTCNEAIITKNGQKRTVIDDPNMPLFAHYVPLIGWQEAGLTVKSAIDITDRGRYPTRQIPVDASLGALALIVDGNAMVSQSEKYYSFTKGAIVFFDPDVRPYIGCYVLARSKQDKTAIFRRLALDSGKVYLEANNPRYQAKEFTKDYQVIGVLVCAKIAPVEAFNPAKMVKKIRYLDELV